MQKVDLLLLNTVDLDHVAVDETMIQRNDERGWLYAAVDSSSNHLLHVRHSPTRTQALTEIFILELHETLLVDDAVFLVDDSPWLQAVCHRYGLRFQLETSGNRTTINVSLVR